MHASAIIVVQPKRKLCSMSTQVSRTMDFSNQGCNEFLLPFDAQLRAG